MILRDRIMMTSRNDFFHTFLLVLFPVGSCVMCKCIHAPFVVLSLTHLSRAVFLVSGHDVSNWFLPMFCLKIRHARSTVVRMGFVGMMARMVARVLVMSVVRVMLFVLLVVSVVLFVLLVVSMVLFHSHPPTAAAVSICLFASLIA